jgi:hypothetical protein
LYLLKPIENYDAVRRWFDCKRANLYAATVAQLGYVAGLAHGNGRIRPTMIKINPGSIGMAV